MASHQPPSPRVDDAAAAEAALRAQQERAARLQTRELALARARDAEREAAEATKERCRAAEIE